MLSFKHTRTVSSLVADIRRGSAPRLNKTIFENRKGGGKWRQKRDGQFLRCSQTPPENLSPMEMPLGLANVTSELSGEIRVVQMPKNPPGEMGEMPEALKGARILVIGKPSEQGCVHSIKRSDGVLTKGYWDTFGILPALVPEGVIGIYGLGGGSIARIIDQYYPSRKMHGWEIDDVVVETSRTWMDLKGVEESGKLEITVGDCLADDAVVEGGFAGIIVDLFSENRVLNDLQDVEIWKKLRSRLKAGGRIIVNLAGDDELIHVLDEAFEGAVTSKIQGENYMAFTGPLPSDYEWKKVPQDLQPQAQGWLGGLQESSDDGFFQDV